MTPRKTRQRHQQAPAQSQPLPSDYESDFYSSAPATAPRTNTELNLSVLRRHVPSVVSILSIAPSAQIYTYSPASTLWNKTEIEGTLFVCTATAGTGYVVVVLNRRGLENLVVDIGSIENVEVTEEFLIVGMEGEKVLGFYVHADRAETREVNCKLIREKWEEVREARGNENGSGGTGQGDNGVAGRKLSLTDLFGGQGI